MSLLHLWSPPPAPVVKRQSRRRFLTTEAARARNRRDYEKHKEARRKAARDRYWRLKGVG